MRLGIAALLTLLLAPPAGAATVTDEDGVIRITAAAGEANDLSLVRTDTGLTVSDANGPLTASAPCQSVSPNTATCAESQLFVAVDAGDEDDHVSAAGAYASLSVDGGDGSDVLDVSATGDGIATIFTLDGGAGDDRLNDGASSDRLIGGVGTDVIDGGAGRHDFVDFSGAAAGVTVDLAAGRADGDEVSGVEGILGSRGKDRLVGDDGPNGIDGGGALDVVDGRGGDDDVDAAGAIHGGAGDDVVSAGAGSQAFGDAGRDFLAGVRAALDGGAGADELQGRGSLLTCGAARDLATLSDSHDTVDPSCERIAAFRGLTLSPLRRQGRTLRLTVTCARTCAGRVRVGRSSASFSGSRALRLRAPAGRVRVTITSGGRRVSYRARVA